MTTVFRKISNSAMKYLILLSCWCQLQAFGSITVKSDKKLSAAVGRNVTLLCQLMTTKANVIQITWQKESGNFSGPVASTSKVYGQKILGHYSNRAKHSSVDALNVSAITISPVIPEDEGCFKCIFNLFPVGASYGTTCLEVYEGKISEPILDFEIIVLPETLEELLVLTCTGSGRPAPNISWNLPLDLQYKSQIFSIANPDGTVTVISNLTHPMNETIEVTCIVHLPALGAEKRLSKLIPYIAGTYSKREDTSTKMPRRVGAVIPLLACFLIILSLIILCYLQRKSKFQNVCHTNTINNFDTDGRKKWFTDMSIRSNRFTDSTTV